MNVLKIRKTTRAIQNLSASHGLDFSALNTSKIISGWLLSLTSETIKNLEIFN